MLKINSNILSNKINANIIYSIIFVFIIILPSLIYGPWIPFVDLIGVTSLGCYPAKLSYGPEHYSLFQITEILPFYLSRIGLDLNIKVSTQVILYYLLQAFISYYVITSICSIIINNVYLRIVTATLGSLAFWNGVSLWGGPLPYSLAASLVSLIVLDTVTEINNENQSKSFLYFTVISLLATCSHPFSIPFTIGIFTLRLIFLNRNRYKDILIIIILVITTYIILKDSPPSTDPRISITAESYKPINILSKLFGVDNNSIAPLTPIHYSKIANLFLWNAFVTKYLFNVSSIFISTFYILLGIIHLTGFGLSLIVSFLSNVRKDLRFISILNSSIFILYLLSIDNLIISQWPQRILLFFSYITFITGIILPYYLYKKYIKSIYIIKICNKIFYNWIIFVEIFIIVLVIKVQIPVLELGTNIEKNFNKINAEILNTNIKNSVLLVDDVNRIAPFYLRSIPLLLYSSSSLIERNIQIVTEWQEVPRIPIRIDGLDKFKPNYKSIFYTETLGNINLLIKKIDNSQ
jgi:hypothetical protein